MKLYQALPTAQQAVKRCTESQHQALESWEAYARKLNNMLPSGSGFDAGCKIISCSDTRLVISADFHHMDDNGYYCGWSEHTVIIEASLAHGFSLRVTGKNKRNIKEYLADTMHECLNQDVAAFEMLKP